MPLLTLPPEILLSIAHTLTLESDLNALIQTNRLFYSLLNSYLYHYNSKWGRGTALLWAAKFGKVGTAGRCLGEGMEGDVYVAERVLHDALLTAAWAGSEAIIGLLLERLEGNGEGGGDGESALRLLAGESESESESESERERESNGNLIIHTLPKGGWIRGSVAIPLAILRRLSGGSRDSTPPQVKAVVLTHSRFHARSFDGEFGKGIEGVEPLPTVSAVGGGSLGWKLPGSCPVLVGMPQFTLGSMLRAAWDARGVRLLVVEQAEGMVSGRLEEACQQIKGLVSHPFLSDISDMCGEANLRSCSLLGFYRRMFRSLSLRRVSPRT
jgi:hypothetical protein